MYSTHLILPLIMSFALILLGRNDINHDRLERGILIIIISILYLSCSIFQDIQYQKNISALSFREIKPWDYDISLTPTDSVTYTPDYYDPWKELDDASPAPKIIYQ